MAVNAKLIATIEQYFNKQGSTFGGSGASGTSSDDFNKGLKDLLKSVKDIAKEMETATKKVISFSNAFGLGYGGLQTISAGSRGDLMGAGSGLMNMYSGYTNIRDKYREAKESDEGTGELVKKMLGPIGGAIAGLVVGGLTLGIQHFF